ncbi:DUF3298 and DUF4163 domain-containing protein [Clostridium sp. DL1XJH146]
MNKKTILLLSVFTTGILLFTACGNDASNNTGNTGNTVTAEEQEDVDTNNSSEKDDYELKDIKNVGINGNFEYDITYPEVSGITNVEVQGKINNLIKEKFAIDESSIDDSKETYTITYKTQQKTSEILSLEINSSLYFDGAAHPNNAIDAITIDMKTGEEIKLQDLFKADVDYETSLNEILKKRMEETEYQLYEEYNGIEENQSFYLTDSSIVFLYSEGAYAPYAVGNIYLEVGFDEVNELLK